ncbi:MAG: hypothetical protein M3Z20_17850 [Chloroflexota bacterium]|nr:hypothetical protein [Chloroflexota bacterium]
MDANTFDALSRLVFRTHTRRAASSLLAGGALGFLGTHATDAKRKKKKKVKLCLDGETLSVPRKKKGKYLGQGATPGACAAPVVIPRCTSSAECADGKRCFDEACVNLELCAAHGDCDTDIFGQCQCSVGNCASAAPQAYVAFPGTCDDCPPGTVKCEETPNHGHNCHPACGDRFPCCTRAGDTCGKAICLF